MAQEITDRIRLIMQEYNLSSSAFADEIGVQRPAMSHILSGRNRPSLDVVMKILKAFDKINSQWLLTGEGKMNQLNLFGEEAKEKPKENTENQLVKQEARLESPVANQPVPSTDTAHSQASHKNEAPIPVTQEKPIEPIQKNSNPIIQEKQVPPYPNYQPAHHSQGSSKPDAEHRNILPDQSHAANEFRTPKQETEQSTGHLAAAMFGDSSGKKVEKIVVLYSDKTFSVYNPE